MKNSKALFQEITAGIKLKESPDEIQSIVYLLVETILGIGKTDILAGKIISVSGASIHALQKAVDRINDHEPVQYVLGEAYFFGRKFQVNASVLIPRPETEELVRAVLDFKAQLHALNVSRPPLRILDIGTGSGCIPITLFQEVEAAEVFATDVSNAALSVARSNADFHQAKITFIEHNIFEEELPVKNLDVIVSNPPYVTLKEKSGMNPNVADYEPHLALFVPDDDPLVFYNEILRKARGTLKASGFLAVEINEQFGHQVVQLFIQEGFKEVAVVNDIAGKQRIVRGLKGSLRL